jgi:toxin ParE1/3/4
MRLQWTKSAVRDFTHICDHADATFGADRARETAMAIHEAVDLLMSFPHIGRPGRKPGTSELVFTGLPFVAVYRVRVDLIEILRILHGAQKWP